MDSYNKITLTSLPPFLAVCSCARLHHLCSGWRHLQLEGDPQQGQGGHPSRSGPGHAGRSVSVSSKPSADYTISRKHCSPSWSPAITALSSILYSQRLSFSCGVRVIIFFSFFLHLFFIFFFTLFYLTPPYYSSTLLPLRQVLLHRALLLLHDGPVPLLPPCGDHC